MTDNIKNDKNDKITLIKNNYFKIHKTIFRYGLFMIIIIISLRKFINIINSDNTIKNITNNDLEVQKTKLISNFLQKLSQTDNNPDITAYITLGETNDNEQVFQSYNNLIAYKGFIIPKVFRISKTTPLQPLSYYESGQYSKEEMETFLKNMIISTNKISETNNKQIQLPITNNIINTFNINCVFQNKIYSQICGFITKNFVDSFFIYNINLDIEGFAKIFNILIQKEEDKERICNNLINYSLYSKDISESINKLIDSCGEKRINIFQRFVYYSEIQKELEEKYISSKTYDDNITNVYKLISFQQIIYNDLSNQRLSTERISGYLSFTQELLKKSRITKFYKEEIYYFNNYYIQKALENPEITSKITDKSDINDIYKQINIINNGSNLIGFKGLITDINPNIIIAESNYVNEEKEEDYEKTLNLLLAQITNFSVKEKFFSGNNILVNGILTIEYNNEQTNNNKYIGLKLRLEEIDKKLHVRQIEFLGNRELTSIVNQLTKKEDRSIVDLQKYIKQNSSLLINSIGNTQNNSTEEICNQIKANLTGQNIQTCNENRILIDIIRKGKITILDITHNNFILEKINIDNSEAKEILNKYLQEPLIQNQVMQNGINKDNITIFLNNVIYNLFNYTSKITAENHEGSTNTIIIIEKIKTYLGITVNDIIEKNGKILVEFSIKNINFIGNYNSETSTIQAIYFKDVIINNLPMLIKDLVIVLDDSHKNEIDQFTINPLGYIKNISPESFLFYQKFISETQK